MHSQSQLCLRSGKGAELPGADAGSNLLREERKEEEKKKVCTLQ